MRLLLGMLAILLAVGVSHGETDVPSRILDVFPPSVARVPAARRGRTILSSAYSPSGSLWDKRLDERMVFQKEIRHQQDGGNSFALRVGKGGQIYSLRGPFGESVPPSWRSGADTSPWNDEVWQFVAVCTRYNGLRASLQAGKLPEGVAARFNSSPYKSTFFIHNSGAYIRGGASIRSLYCPLLASAATGDGRGYRTLSWGLIPQVRTVHRSPVLYYGQTRDVGDGVIELTWVVHNFSVRDDVVFDHLNAPWGGTRVSALPYRYISSPAGALRGRREVLKNTVVGVRATGGWSLSCASEAPDSPALAFVFGRDKHLEEQLKKAADGKPHVQFRPSLYRDWRAGEGMYRRAWKDWRTRPANSFRNYDVATVVPKLALAPGSSIWYRCFLVVHRRDKAVELAKSLVGDVDYGLATFDAAEAPMVPVSLPRGQAAGEGPAGFELLSRPVKGTMPVFLVEDTKTGRHAVTTDPYLFVPREKVDFGVPEGHPHHAYYGAAYGYSLDRNTCRWERLLGFGYVRKPTGGSFVRLSRRVGASLFPKADEHHLDLWVKPAGRGPNGRGGVPGVG